MFYFSCSILPFSSISKFYSLLARKSTKYSTVSQYLFLLIFFFVSNRKTEKNWSHTILVYYFLFQTRTLFNRIVSNLSLEIRGCEGWIISITIHLANLQVHIRIDSNKNTHKKFNLHRKNWITECNYRFAEEKSNKKIFINHFQLNFSFNFRFFSE